MADTGDQPVGLRFSFSDPADGLAFSNRLADDRDTAGLTVRQDPHGMGLGGAEVLVAAVGIEGIRSLARIAAGLIASRRTTIEVTTDRRSSTVKLDSSMSQAEIEATLQALKRSTDD